MNVNLSEAVGMISEVSSTTHRRLEGILVRLRGQTPETADQKPLAAQGVFAPLERTAGSLQAVARLVDELDAIVGHETKHAAEGPKVGGYLRQ